MVTEVPTKQVCDHCGYAVIFQQRCPNCNEPFCSEDHAQGTRVALIRSELLRLKVNQIINWANNLPAGIKPDPPLIEMP